YGTAGKIQPANAVAGVIRDEQASLVVDGDAGRVVQTHRRRIAFPRVARLPVAGDSRDNTGRVHFPNPVIERIGDVDVSCGVYRHTLRTIQSGVGGRAAVPA